MQEFLTKLARYNMVKCTLKNLFSTVDVNMKELNTIVRGKTIEGINEVDANTIDINISSQKTIRMLKNEKGEIEISVLNSYELDNYKKEFQ